MMEMNCLFVLMLLVAIYPVYSSVDVKCFDKDSEGHEDARCTVESIDSTPWSSKTDITAPTPYSLDVKWYTAVRDARRIILLNITWSQPVYKIKRYVKGYYMEIKPSMMIGPGYKKKFNVNIHDMQVKKKDLVYFNYDTFGKLQFELIQPSYSNSVKYYFSLHALPLYHADEEKRDIDASITIPGCGMGNREIDGTDTCKYFEEQEKARREREDLYENSGDSEYGLEYY